MISQQVIVMRTTFISAGVNDFRSDHFVVICDKQEKVEINVALGDDNNTNGSIDALIVG